MTAKATPFSLADFALGLKRDGTASVQALRRGPPPSSGGLDVGLAAMTRPPPHGGEMHPDGDEVLYLISGEISVLLEEESERTVRMQPGECFIVPKGIWHRLLVHSPCELLYMTPGPNSQHRPRGRTARRS